MNTSTRFAVATHILTVIAMQDGPVSSAQLACSVNTSAAVVRQLLMRLSDVDLVKSRMGPGGGSLLTRDAGEITLLDVWKATEEEQVFGMHRKEPSQKCTVGRHILDALGDLSDEAREAFFGPLKRQSIADMVAFVKQRESECKSPCNETGQP